MGPGSAERTCSNEGRSWYRADLKYPDASLLYMVVMNTSQFALGVVLMEDHGDGLWPLALCSRRLKPTEQMHLPYKCELAAVAYNSLTWRHYLEDVQEES